MKNTLITAAALALISSTAYGASVTSSAFNQTDWNTYINNLGPNQVLEDFEDEGAAGGETEYLGGVLGTSVGDFKATPTSQTGTGGTVTGLAGNTGADVAIRNGNVFGRSNSTPGGRWFLDSNDITELQWDVSIGGSMFSSLSFVLADAADVGSAFSVFVNGSVVADFSKPADASVPNGVREIITVDFGTNVSSATILFTSLPKDDGFGIDDVVVNAVPLPAAAWMLIAGVGALGAASRRKRKAA